MFYEKGVIRNFTNFTGKHLRQSLFFDKVADLTPATLLKKKLAQVVDYGFCEISKNTFIQSTTERLPLHISFTWNLWILKMKYYFHLRVI